MNFKSFSEFPAELITMIVLYVENPLDRYNLARSSRRLFPIVQDTKWESIESEGYKFFIPLVRMLNRDPNRAKEVKSIHITGSISRRKLPCSKASFEAFASYMCKTGIIDRDITGMHDYFDRANYQFKDLIGTIFVHWGFYMLDYLKNGDPSQPLSLLILHLPQLRELTIDNGIFIWISNHPAYRDCFPNLHTLRLGSKEIVRSLNFQVFTLPQIRTIECFNVGSAYTMPKNKTVPLTSLSLTWTDLLEFERRPEARILDSGLANLLNACRSLKSLKLHGRMPKEQYLPSTTRGGVTWLRLRQLRQAIRALAPTLETLALDFDWDEYCKIIPNDPYSISLAGFFNLKELAVRYDYMVRASYDYLMARNLPLSPTLATTLPPNLKKLTLFRFTFGDHNIDDLYNLAWKKREAHPNLRKVTVYYILGGLTQHHSDISSVFNRVRFDCEKEGIEIQFQAQRFEILRDTFWLPPDAEKWQAANILGQDCRR